MKNVSKTFIIIEVKPNMPSLSFFYQWYRSLLQYISDNHMHNFTCAYKMPINFRTVTYANTISFSPDLFYNNKTKYLGARSFALNKGNS